MSAPHLGITGRRGEEIAREYLENLGLELIETNARVPGGELDLVMQEKVSKEIVIVEVKTRTFAKYGDAISAITKYKARVLKRSIAMYMQNYPWKTDYRLDLVAIMLTNGEPKIEHIKYVSLDLILNDGW